MTRYCVCVVRYPPPPPPPPPPTTNHYQHHHHRHHHNYHYHYYQVRLPGALRFNSVILMTNVVAHAGARVLHEMYDLKGSYVDRRAITSSTAAIPETFAIIRKASAPPRALLLV